MCAGLLRLVARQLVCSIPASELQLDASEGNTAKTKERRASARSVDKHGFELPPPPVGRGQMES